MCNIINIMTNNYILFVLFSFLSHYVLHFSHFKKKISLPSTSLNKPLFYSPVSHRRERGDLYKLREKKTLLILLSVCVCELLTIHVKLLELWFQLTARKTSSIGLYFIFLLYFFYILL